MNELFQKIRDNFVPVKKNQNVMSLPGFIFPPIPGFQTFNRRRSFIPGPAGEAPLIRQVTEADDNQFALAIRR